MLIRFPLRLRPFFLLLSLLFLGACVGIPLQPTIAPAPAGANLPANTSETNRTQAPSPTLPAEVVVTPIPLSGPSAQAQAEISGLGWYGDLLILLPQYPERMGSSDEGALFALPKAAILAFLEGQSTGPLEPQAVAFDAGSLRSDIRGYEGYEAIAFSGDTAFLTIEASPVTGMKSYLVRGETAPDLNRLALDTSRLVEVPLDAEISNFSNEAILVWGERVILFYEANGAEANPQARAYVYDFDLNLTGHFTMPPLEYRLTDAASPDENGRFWVSNFFYPGDIRIFPRSDPLEEQYGKGLSHSVSSVVERLVELQLPEGEEGAITFAGTPPVQIQLAPGQIPRNWEGLARLDDRGFLLATDKFPETILAFVAGSASAP